MTGSGYGLLRRASFCAQRTEGDDVEGDRWVRADAVRGSEPTGDVLDGHHRCEEDTRLLAEAGPSADRLSIERARVAAPGNGDFAGVQSCSPQRVDENSVVRQPPRPDLTRTGAVRRTDPLGIAVRHAREVAGLPILATVNGIATADDTRRVADRTTFARTPGPGLSRLGSVAAAPGASL